MKSSDIQFIEDIFMRAKQYPCPIKIDSVSEATPSFNAFTFSERHLQALWYDPHLRPKNLITTQHKPVEVKHAGSWNLEAGPDFLNATLLVGKEKKELSGDLEIHIHPKDWNQHGHTNDPRYKKVRFHVVYFQGLEIPGLIQIPLQAILEQSPQFSFENIDISAYPYKITGNHFPLRHLDPDKKFQWLESAGEKRLLLKAKRMQARLETVSAEQLLWEELLAGLGYKNNKVPFQKLAQNLPCQQLKQITQTPKEAYAILLGCSGLLPATLQDSWTEETKTFIRSLWDFWWKQSEEIQKKVLPKTEWTLTGVRPQNHPNRRLMAAAYYLFQGLELSNDWKKLTAFPSNYWNNHLNWKPTRSASALVGQARANTLIVNVLVPFLAATQQPVDLKKLPTEPSNSIIRQTAFQLFGPDHTPKTYSSALARQGLIQVFYDYVLTHQLQELSAKTIKF